MVSLPSWLHQINELPFIACFHELDDRPNRALLVDKEDLLLKGRDRKGTWSLNMCFVLLYKVMTLHYW